MGGVLCLVYKRDMSVVSEHLQRYCWVDVVVVEEGFLSVAADRPQLPRSIASRLRTLDMQPCKHPGIHLLSRPGRSRVGNASHRKVRV